MDYSANGNQKLYKSVLNHKPSQGGTPHCVNHRHDVTGNFVRECGGKLRFKDNEFGFCWYICTDCGSWQLRRKMLPV